MSLRHQKTEGRRRDMIAAAQRLFREHGYAQTTVKSIAGAAGVSPRTFYRYFGSKDGVLAARGLDLVVSVAEQLPADASMKDVVHRLVSELGASAETDPTPRLVRTLPQLSDRAAVWRKQWSEHLAYELASRDGQSEPSITHRVNSTVAIHVTGLILDEWFLRRRHEDLPLLTDEVIGILYEGLAP